MIKVHGGLRKLVDIYYGGLVFEDCRWTHLKAGRKPYRKKNYPAAIYSFWDTSGNCLYVGKTIDINARLNQHKKAGLIQDIDRVRVMWFSNLADLHICEPYLINTLQPKHNLEFTTDHKTSFKLDLGPWHDFTDYWLNTRF